MSTKMKWALLIGLFLLVGGTALILGFYFAGADILGWFTTKWAFIVYFFIGVYLFGLASLAIYDYTRR